MSILKWFSSAFLALAVVNVLLLLTYQPYVDWTTDQLQRWQPPGRSISSRTNQMSLEFGRLRSLVLRHYMGAQRPPPSTLSGLLTELSLSHSDLTREYNIPAICRHMDYHGQPLHYQLDVNEEQESWTMYLWSNGMNRRDEQRTGDDKVLKIPGVMNRPPD